MKELLGIIAGMQFADLVDIFLVAALFYFLFALLKETRSAVALRGLISIMFVSFLGYIPIGAAIWPGFTAVLDWIFNIQSGSSRAIVVAAALGTFALCLRVLLGQEKAFLGVEGGEGGGE